MLNVLNLITDKSLLPEGKKLIEDIHTFFEWLFDCKAVNENVKQCIKTIDGALEVYDGDVYVTRIGSSSLSNLSAGCKTALILLKLSEENNNDYVITLNSIGSAALHYVLNNINLEGILLFTSHADIPIINEVEYIVNGSKVNSEILEIAIIGLLKGDNAISDLTPNLLIYENLKLKRKGLTFDLNFESRVTVLRGESSTMKSFLVKSIWIEQRVNRIYQSIIIIDWKNSYELMRLLNMPEVRNKGVLYLIDDIDSELNREVQKFISSDKYNQYLLISRSTNCLNVNNDKGYVILNTNDGINYRFT